jgi:hypothetical protein
MPSKVKRFPRLGLAGAVPCSAVLVLVGWWIRNSVAESRTFEDELAAAEAPPKVPAAEVFASGHAR